MSADNQNITMCAGDTLIINIPIKDGSGNAVQLTEPVGYWKLANFGNNNIVLSKDTINTSTMTISLNPTTNFWVLQIGLIKDDTLPLTPGSYYQQVQIVDGTSEGVITTGTITINRTL